VRFLLTFAFIPARYGTDPLAAGALPGGFGAELWTFFTYAFIHADLMHLGLNLAWLLPFGTALARRFGAWRYAVFMLVMAAAGAFAHLVSHPGAMVPMIGASAAISGAMAAAMRSSSSATVPSSCGGRAPTTPPTGSQPRRWAPRFANTRFLIFLGSWIGLNALAGLGSVVARRGRGADRLQANIGGFIAGLLLFSAFDPGHAAGRTGHRAQRVAGCPRSPLS